MSKFQNQFQKPDTDDVLSPTKVAVLSKLGAAFDLQRAVHLGVS